MIEPPCTVMVNRIFPETRKRAALNLRREGWKQNEIAKALGVTQAMVSRYLSAEIEGFPAEIEKGIQVMVGEISNMLMNKRSEPEIISTICRNCFAMREHGSMCLLHPVENCRVCMNLRSDDGMGIRKEVLDDVREAIKILEGELSPHVVPEVRINIASALPDALGPAEVVAIPGRLLEIRGEIKALTEPEFGASQHLSAILLAAKRKQPDIRGVVNILFNDVVEKALISMNMPFTEFDGKNIPDGWRGECLAYRGAYGREPCLYIFGNTATEATEIARKISDETAGEMVE